MVKKVEQDYYDEILEELKQLSAKRPSLPKGYHTIKELEAKWGLSNCKVRSLLKAAMDRGQLDVVFDKRPRLDGRIKTVATFKILRNAK